MARRDNPVSYGASAAERLEAVENAMYYISDAMDFLRGFGEYEDAFNTLDDLYGELESTYADLDREAAGDHAEMLSELTREYYRDVL